jgi:hypothetical protein
MGKVTVDQILAEAKTLSRDEQEQLRDTLDAWLRSKRPEEQLERPGARVYPGLQGSLPSITCHAPEQHRLADRHRGPRPCGPAGSLAAPGRSPGRGKWLAVEPLGELPGQLISAVLAQGPRDIEDLAADDR